MINGFPSFEKWCEDVLHPEDTHPWNFRTRAFYEEYQAKFVIAKLVRPERILEVGVRFGYSARSFMMAAPEAEYIGIDFDEPSWGSYQGVPRKWAEEQLKRLYLGPVQTFKLNTQIDSFAYVEPFDLVHIDGDHSFEGALHDMNTFWSSCRNTMVVDDYQEVAPAVDVFLKEHSDDAIMLTVASFRSSALLVRTNGGPP